MITCKFICKQCGADGVPFRVRARTSEEDLIRWMKEVVQVGMGEAHRRFAPHCKALHADLLLPAPKNAEWIGQDVETA